MQDTTRHAVVSDADAAFNYITAQYPLGRTEDWKGIVQLRDGEIIAAVGYDQYNGANIFMHVASDGTSRWGTRHFLHEIFKYPFRTLGVDRITVWVERDNIASRRLVTNVGFTAEAVLQSAGRDGVDVLIYRMFRQECRYA
jgi:RimJ/RimL family protein N-acetyltransferase